MKVKDITTPRNFVAKHLRGMSGAGAHDLKKGNKKAKRAKQKQELRREIKNIDY